MSILLQIIGKKILRQASEKVEFPNNDLSKIIESMFVVMYKYAGVGLAANQVGISKRIAVIDCKLSKNPKDQIVLINPEIIETSGEQENLEGCLSIPGLACNLKRPNYIKVKTLDLNGNEKIIEATDLEARAILHEIDHLDGKLFIDRLEPLDRMLVEGKIKKIARQFKRL